MKMVINNCFGGFSLSDAAVQQLGLNSPYSYIDRCDERLVALVEQDADAVNGWCARLKVVEIPDEATDTYLEEYDGAERLLYVLDGHIHFAGLQDDEEEEEEDDF